MNENCLENRACPECGEQDDVLVVVSMMVSLTDDGTDPYADSVSDTSVEYSDSVPAVCPSCGYRGVFREWSSDGCSAVRWIDGQTRDGGSSALTRLELRRTEDDGFRWFTQGYTDEGIPSGPCCVDTEVGGSSRSAALDAARTVWARYPWNLRKTCRLLVDLSVYIPSSIQDATEVVSELGGEDLNMLDRESFMRLWVAVVYLNPGLHADNEYGPEDLDNASLQAVLAELDRRDAEGGLTDLELYPYPAVIARLTHERRGWT